jgi:uncharacterized protein (DUF433 family)
MSLRLPAATRARITDRAKRLHMPPRTLTQRYVEEGLRMDEHPLVHFADGPAGRRPRLAGTGLDVWEAIATLRDNDGDERAAAAYLGISVGLVQAALAYYGAFRDEIDEWISVNEREADAAHRAFLAGRAALGEP